MTATTVDRETLRFEGELLEYEVAAGVKCLAGTMAALNTSGYVQPATTSSSVKILGRFGRTVDNTSGSNGELTVPVRKGCFVFDNSTLTDEITIEDIGNVCYCVDNQTVAKTNGSGTRSPAGVVENVFSNGVLIELGRLGRVFPANPAVTAVKISNPNVAVQKNKYNVVDGGTGLSGLTLAAPSVGDFVQISIYSITSGTVVVTAAAGTTLNGTNNTATFNAAGDELMLVYDTTNTWCVVRNNSVSLTSV